MSKQIIIITISYQRVRAANGFQVKKKQHKIGLKQTKRKHVFIQHAIILRDVLPQSAIKPEGILFSSKRSLNTLTEDRPSVRHDTLVTSSGNPFLSDYQYLGCYTSRRIICVCPVYHTFSIRKVLRLFQWSVRHMLLGQGNLHQVCTVQYLCSYDLLLYTQTYTLIKVTCKVTMTLQHSSWQRAGCLYPPLWSQYGYTFPMQNSILYHFPLQHHSSRLFF